MELFFVRTNVGGSDSCFGSELQAGQVMAKALSYSLKLNSVCSNELPSLLVAVPKGGVLSALAQCTPRWKPTAI
jgi:hypothetical protein